MIRVAKMIRKWNISSGLKKSNNVNIVMSIYWKMAIFEENVYENLDNNNETSNLVMYEENNVSNRRNDKPVKKYEVPIYDINTICNEENMKTQQWRKILKSEVIVKRNERRRDIKLFREAIFEWWYWYVKKLKM